MMRGIFRMWEAKAEAGSGSDASAEATREHTRGVAEGIQLEHCRTKVQANPEGKALRAV